jgi:DNA-binding transcriptional LysR family regulator
MLAMKIIERSNPRLDSEALRTFLVVAERGNVTHAAQELLRTQSAISVQIKHLESDLGVSLFNRQARGMTLTSAGEKLLVSAKSIIPMLDRAAINLLDDPVQGMVTVGIPDDYGSELLASILADFARRHPQVEVNIQCGFSVAFPKAVTQGKLDLAVYASDEENTQGDILFEEQTVWVGRSTDSIALTRPLPVALFDRACWWRDSTIHALDQAGIPYRIAYSSESVAGVKAAVKAGLAVGVLARSTLEPSMEIVGKSHGLPHLPSSNLMLIRNNKARSGAVEAMAKAISRGFSEYITR